MFSLLVLSLALSTASTATPAVVPDDPLVTPLPAVVIVPGEISPIKVDLPESKFDAMEVRPDSDICYKIRAYVFTKGPDPKFVRETTCGPKRPVAKDAEGATKPKLMPLNTTVKPSQSPDR